jgi:hypothetical protein
MEGAGDFDPNELMMMGQDEEGMGGGRHHQQMFKQNSNSFMSKMFK